MSWSMSFPLVSQILVKMFMSSLHTMREIEKDKPVTWLKTQLVSITKTISMLISEVDSLLVSMKEKLRESPPSSFTTEIFSHPPIQKLNLLTSSNRLPSSVKLVSSTAARDKSFQPSALLTIGSQD